MRHRLPIPLFFIAASVCAQVKEPLPLIHATFRVLSMEEAILGAGYLEGKDLRRLDISGDAFTAEQSYVGVNPLRLVDLTEPTAATRRVDAMRQRQEIQAKLQALAQELQGLQSKALKPKNGAENGGGRRLESSPRLGAGDDRASEIQRTMGMLSQQLELIEGQINGADVTRSEPSEKDAAKPKAGQARKEELPLPSHRPLATFSFPGDGRFLLLVHRTAAGTTVNAIDDREGAFPYGSMQFVNLTAGPVEVRFGTKILALTPKAKGTLRPAAGHNSYALGEVHTRGEDGQFHLGYSMRIFQQDDVRTLYFLLPTEDGGRGVRLKGVEDRRAVEPAPPAAGLPGEKPAATLR